MNPRLEAVNHAIRLLLVDDQSIVREGLRLLLENNKDIKVIAEASSYDEAIALALKFQPDIVLMDLDLGGNISGKDCLPEVLRVAPHSRIVVLTGTPDTDLHFKSICQGASGLVHKLEASGVLLNAIHQVHRGEVWLDGNLMANVLKELWRIRDHADSVNSVTSSHLIKKSNGTFIPLYPISGPIPPEQDQKIALLTNREREVIELIGQGMRNQMIADRLYISVITVRHHLSSIFSKLEVNDRFELAIYSYRYGLAKLPS